MHTQFDKCAYVCNHGHNNTGCGYAPRGGACPHKSIPLHFQTYLFFYGGNCSFFTGTISTTNFAACVCARAKFDQFLPGRSHFDSKRPEIFFRIATFPSATFGPLFAFHCPLLFTKNNNLEWKSSRFATRDVLKTVIVMAQNTSTPKSS